MAPIITPKQVKPKTAVKNDAATLDSTPVVIAVPISEPVHEDAITNFDQGQAQLPTPAQSSVGPVTRNKKRQENETSGTTKAENMMVTSAAASNEELVVTSSAENTNMGRLTRNKIKQSTDKPDPSISKSPKLAAAANQDLAQPSTSAQAMMNMVSAAVSNEAQPNLLSSGRKIPPSRMAKTSANNADLKCDENVAKTQAVADGSATFIRVPSKCLQFISGKRMRLILRRCDEKHRSAVPIPVQAQDQPQQIEPAVTASRQAASAQAAPATPAQAVPAQATPSAQPAAAQPVPAKAVPAKPAPAQAAHAQATPTPMQLAPVQAAPAQAAPAQAAPHEPLNPEGRVLRRRFPCEYM